MTPETASVLRYGHGERDAQSGIVKETPGTVSVIDAETIERRLIENIADLVKFEPGVYIETNLTRIGLNGFNIRGIGGNRVMTQVDGVETSEQFDFGPFNVHQFAARPRHAEEGRDRPQRRVVALRQRRARRRRLVLHEGSGRLPAQPRASTSARKTLYRQPRVRHQRQRRRRRRPPPRAGVAVRQLRPRPRAAQQGHASTRRTRRGRRSIRRIAAASRRSARSSSTLARRQRAARRGRSRRHGSRHRGLLVADAQVAGRR